jgi:hypothetical protein
LSRKVVHKWVEKLSQRRSKVADDARPGRPVEIVTEASVQRVEDLNKLDRRVRTDSIAIALVCSHFLSYSTMHDRSKFRKVCARWVPRELKDLLKIKGMDLSLQHLLRYTDEGEDMLNRIANRGRIIGVSLPTRIKACFSAIETSQFTSSLKV